MKKVRRFFKGLVKHPKTSATGIATLVGIGFAAASNPAILADPLAISAAISAAGLLVAADSKD